MHISCNARLVAGSDSSLGHSFLGGCFLRYIDLLLVNSLLLIIAAAVALRVGFRRCSFFNGLRVPCDDQAFDY